MDQLSKLAAGLSGRQKIGIVLVALFTVAATVGFTRWNRESDFKLLYSAMAPEDAAAVVQKLKEGAFDYRLAENGASVLVPSAAQAEARLALAAAGLPKTGRIGFELFDKTSFGATEFVEHINYKRALEGELERTVMSLSEVEQARVHLTLPKESIFLDQQQPAKASVVVKLRPSARISPQNVLAITNLVASAVEGLAPESVSIVDMNGALLNRPRRTGDANASQITAEALEVRQQLERDLVAKIQSTLEPVLGSERFRAGASIECDLTSGEQQEETFDPSRSVMVSSQKTEDTSERASVSGGVPGTSSNLPGAASQPGSGGGASRRTENVTYQSSRVVRQTHIPQGVIRRMSLSVLLDHSVQWEGSGASRKRVLTPPDPDTLKTIRDLVAAATGFNADRGDQLIVESLPFESTVNFESPAGASPVRSAPAPAGPAWLNPIMKNRTLILSVVIGAAILLLLVRGIVLPLLRRKNTRRPEAPLELPPSPVATRFRMEAREQGEPGLESAARGAAGSDMSQLAGRARQVVTEDTKAAANVVRLWMQEKAPSV